LIGQVVDISKLFNPQSYLTAIKQICCQNQGLELDKLQVFTEVTKKEPKQIEGPCKDGAYVSGMFLEGARWDMTSNSLEDSKPKEMFTAMPVITCKAGAWSDMFPSSCGLYGLSLVVRAVVVMEFRQDLPGFRVLILRQFIRRSIFSEPHSDSEVWQPRKRTRTSTFAPPIASLRDVRISCLPRSCEPKLPQTSGCWQEWLGWVKPG